MGRLLYTKDSTGENPFHIHGSIFAAAIEQVPSLGTRQVALLSVVLSVSQALAWEARQERSMCLFCVCFCVCFCVFFVSVFVFVFVFVFAFVFVFVPEQPGKDLVCVCAKILCSWSNLFRPGRRTQCVPTLAPCSTQSSSIIYPLETGRRPDHSTSTLPQPLCPRLPASSSSLPFTSDQVLRSLKEIRFV